MLERVIAHINKHEGVEWVKMEDICDEFKAKNTPVKGAVLPAESGAILKDKGELFFLLAFGRLTKIDMMSRFEIETARVRLDCLVMPCVSDC
jgi:hypothetical protein